MEMGPSLGTFSILSDIAEFFKYVILCSQNVFWEGPKGSFSHHSTSLPLLTCKASFISFLLPLTSNRSTSYMFNLAFLASSVP